MSKSNKICRASDYLYAEERNLMKYAVEKLQPYLPTEGSQYRPSTVKTLSIGGEQLKIETAVLKYDENSKWIIDIPDGSVTYYNALHLSRWTNITREQSWRTERSTGVSIKKSVAANIHVMGSRIFLQLYPGLEIDKTIEETVELFLQTEKSMTIKF